MIFSQPSADDLESEGSLDFEADPMSDDSMDDEDDEEIADEDFEEEDIEDESLAVDEQKDDTSAAKEIEESVAKETKKNTTANTKYVPPQLRRAAIEETTEEKLALERLRKQLKGLINRWLLVIYSHTSCYLCV